MSGGAVFVALTRGGLDLARRLAEALPGAEVHGLAGRTDGADVTFEAAVAHLRELFRAGRPIVGVCAAGVLVRALAPLLADKGTEPPVLALAEDGSAVVPLLGGHRGANDLARRIAAALGIAPAITTAGDLRFGVALDAPPPGWRLANPRDHKAFMAALLDGATLRLQGAAPWLEQSGLPFAEDGTLTIRITEHRATGSARRLVYHPATLCLGLGCERNAGAEEVLDLARQTLAEHDLAEGAVAAVVSIDLKADEPAVHAVADALGVPARFFPAARLEAEAPRLANPSELVFREVGCHGVAEGAALAAAGPAGELVAPKVKSARATCAIARAPEPLRGHEIGCGRAVALVCSGDPGIYAMAALVFESLDREPRPEWRRAEITVVPGISALQAAAARAGAPLGHDFCAISLSDLLTPWAAIEKRLRAAAEGDFVVALYNPVSRRRTTQLLRAAEILRRKRPAETPVVLARNLGREGETVTLIRLDELTPEKVDMLTLVLVGSRETRRIERGDGGAWVYTPRGYAAKADKDSEDAA